MDAKRVGNLFTSLERQHGQHVFVRPEKIEKVRNRLIQFIKAHQNYTRVVLSVVKGALAYYNRRCSSIKDSIEKIQYKKQIVGVLVMAAHLCQEYNISKTEGLLLKIMSAILEVENGFDRFMGFLDPLATTHRLDAILFPKSKDHPDLRNSNYHYKVLEYFLREIGTVPMKMLISQSVTRGNRSYAMEFKIVSFVDAPLPTSYGCTPLTLSCHAINRRAIVTLLRYGADPEARGSIHLELGSDYPINVLLMQHHALNYWRDRFADSVRDDPDHEVRVTYHDYDQQQLEVRRCVAFMNRTVLDLSKTAGRRIHSLQGMLTLLPSVQLGTPRTLQHICRLQVRSLLKQVGRLPHGIKKLEVHSILHNYLELRFD